MSQKTPGPAIAAVDGGVPTSLAQARLWFADQVGLRGTEFVYPYAMRLHGELNVAALAGAVDLVVARHEALRTTFCVSDGEPLQVIHEPFSLGLTAMRVSDGTALADALRDAVEQPFDLVEGPVLRVRLFRERPKEHVFLMVIHHIATDGWSMEVIFRDIAEAYRARVDGRPADLPHLRLKYADVAADERRHHASGGYTEDLLYWRKQLEGCPHLVQLPLDRMRPTKQSFRGGCVGFTVPTGIMQLVDALAAASGSSTYMVLLTAFQVLLSRWSGQRDFIVGVPVSGRERSESEHMVGFFMNLLPLRARVDLGISFRNLLAVTRESALDAYDHQAPSFDLLVDEVAPERSMAHNPLIQVTFTMEKEPQLDLPGIEAAVLGVHSDVTRYDLAFDYYVRADNTIRFDVFYASDLFDRSTIDELVRRYVCILGTVLGQPDLPLGSLPQQSPASEAEVLAAGRGPDLTKPLKGLLERFAATVAAQPDVIAVTSGATELTFAELDRRAGQIAAHVSAYGVGAESIVGICLPRSAEMLAAILGVLRAGAAYMSLDPRYPADRLRLLVADSGSELVLADTDAPGDEVYGDVRVVRTDEVVGDPLASSGYPGPDRLAYVFYTSGSTDRPKGVQITHGSVASLLAALEQADVIRAGRGRVGWNASPSFDASVQQWIRVCRGDTVVILDEAQRRSPEELVEVVAAAELTDLDITPSHAELVIPHLADRPADLQLWVGGEKLPASLWTALATSGGIKAVNVYGTTETTVDSTWAAVSVGSMPHLGESLPDQAVRVLDEMLRPVPRGTAGELYLAGAGLARGYLGRPGLTAARFLPDPWAGGGSRMYRTGDRARWTADGRLEFLGRLDHQVKVRGFRVELGEVEATLAAHPGVLACAVVKREQTNGALLVAFVQGTPAVTVDGLRAHADQRLPEWMRPASYTLVNAIPLTAAGKIDRVALLKNPPTAADAVTAPAPVAPRSATEDLLIRICEEVLGVDGLGPEDHFFQAGGHSLLAIRVVARLKRQAQLTIPMAAVFQNPVLRDLAAVVETTIRERLAES